MGKRISDNQLKGLATGLIAIVFGIVIAICGIGTAIDTCFGILFLLAGVVAIGVNCLLFYKRRLLVPATLMLGGAALAIAIGLFVHFLSFGYLVPLFLLSFIGAGSAFVVVGIFNAFKINAFYGIGEAVIGAGVVTLCALYLNIPGFDRVFWIIVGVLVAVYGLFTVIFSLVNKEAE